MSRVRAAGAVTLAVVITLLAAVALGLAGPVRAQDAETVPPPLVLAPPTTPPVVAPSSAPATPASSVAATSGSPVATSSAPAGGGPSTTAARAGTVAGSVDKGIDEQWSARRIAMITVATVVLLAISGFVYGRIRSTPPRSTSQALVPSSD